MGRQIGHYDDSQGCPGLTIQQLQRFWCSYKKGTPEECWPWIKTIRKREGVNKNILYGNFSISGRNYLAHRVSYQLEYGPTQECILHECDFGLCVNPRHLFVGTRADNNRDMAAKGRHVAWRRYLTDLQVAQIWTLKGKITQQELAESFKVSLGVIQALLQGRTYRG